MILQDPPKVGCSLSERELDCFTSPQPLLVWSQEPNAAEHHDSAVSKLSACSFRSHCSAAEEAQQATHLRLPVSQTVPPKYGQGFLHVISFDQAPNIDQRNRSFSSCCSSYFLCALACWQTWCCLQGLFGEWRTGKLCGRDISHLAMWGTHLWVFCFLKTTCFSHKMS